MTYKYLIFFAVITGAVCLVPSTQYTSVIRRMRVSKSIYRVSVPFHYFTICSLSELLPTDLYKIKQNGIGEAKVGNGPVPA